MEKHASNEINSGQKNISHEEEIDLSKKQIILYTALIGSTITICILAMIGINLFALLIIIGVVLVYVLLDDDIRTETSDESLLETENKNNN
jgi:hypothetical protein